MKLKFKNASGGSNVSSRKNRGAISLEYILIIVVVVLACLVGMKIFGGRIGNTINSSKDAVVNTTDNVFNQLGGTASGGAGSGGSGSTGGAEADDSVVINEANFPDATFRTYVATNFDTDGDGKLASDERNAVTSMDASDMGITSLQGVEYFESLTGLDCQGNQLTTLNISSNTALKRLYCQDNQLTSLDVSNNTALELIFGRNNQLTTLDLTHNPSLSSSNVVVDNTVTVTYYGESGSGSGESSGSGSTITGIEEDGSVLINETNFPDATFRTYVATNFDTDSDGKLASDERNAVTQIDIYSQGVTTLKGVEYFTALTRLDCSYNQLTALDVSNNTALAELYCDDNQLTTLDVSKNTALTRLSYSNNQLATLDISKNTALTHLYCNDNQLTTLDLSNNTALTYLNCSSNPLKTLDVSNNTALTHLECSNNQLTSLDISNNTALKKLICWNNELTTLDLSNNPALNELSCRYNKITTLDLTHNPLLNWSNIDAQDQNIDGKYVYPDITLAS